MDLSALTFSDYLFIIVVVVVITYYSFKSGSKQRTLRKRQNLRKHESDKEMIGDKAKNASGDQEGLYRSRSLIGRP